MLDARTTSWFLRALMNQVEAYWRQASNDLSVNSHVSCLCCVLSECCWLSRFSPPSPPQSDESPVSFNLRIPFSAVPKTFRPPDIRLKLFELSWVRFFYPQANFHEMPKIKMKGAICMVFEPIFSIHRIYETQIHNTKNRNVQLCAPPLRQNLYLLFINPCLSWIFSASASLFPARIAQLMNPAAVERKR